MEMNSLHSDALIPYNGTMVDSYHFPLISWLLIPFLIFSQKHILHFMPLNYVINFGFFTIIRV